MNKWTLLCCGVLVVASACVRSESPTGGPDPEPDAREQFKQFAAKAEAALGVFHDIHVFERTGKTWGLASSKHVLREFVPVEVNDKVPPRYEKDMQSDRPMMLPTHVEGWDGGDGQSSPYSVVGRMPGSNPEVQWVFAVRQYWIKELTDDNFPDSPDMAVIGHHPRTGASVYLQYYDPEHPKSGQVVVSPFSDGGVDFWSPLKTIANEFNCQRCHAAVPFIHTPWINQVRVREDDPEPMVPSDPLGPFFFIDSDEGELFAPWNDALIASKGGGHLSKLENRCTECHRVSPDLIGLNENSTRYAGLDGRAGNNWSVVSDSNQTPEYRALHWMPPLAAPYVDFYAGQKEFAPNWEHTYGKSAAEVNRLTYDNESWRKAIEEGLVADVPRPPKPYQTIVVDRPEQDQVQPNQSVWIVDTRMRANTDGDLHQWRFYAKGPANDNMRAAPVVYRRMSGDGSTIEFKVVSVGTPRDYTSAGQYVPVWAEQTTYPIKQGDYLGVVFTNTGSESGPATIPYTRDEWAKLKMPDDTTWLRDGSVTYWLTTGQAPVAGKQIVFKDADFRTYSFEFRNKLGAAAGK